jgi:type I restriction enzyme S subunit
MPRMQTETAFKYLNEVCFKSLSNWSAGAILSNKVLYKDGFKLEPIGILIIRNREKEILEDDKAYKQVTIKLYGKGVVQRGDELILGKNIGTKNQFRVSEGQFIMSKIDARNGAFGIVPAELEGAITTQDFLSYNINTEKILPEFFNLITSTKHFAELCQKASSGTTGRQRVDEKAFLGFRIPVPRIEVQKEIVQQYNDNINLAIKYKEQSIELANSIQEIIYKELGILKGGQRSNDKKFQLIDFSSITFWGVDKILNKESFSSSKYETVDMESKPTLYLNIFRGKSPKYDPNGRKIILNQKCNRWNSIELEHAKTVNDKWYNNVDSKLLSEQNDIIINSTGEGTIGRASLITAGFEGLLIDSHMLLLRTNNEVLSSRYLVHIINSEYGQRQIESLKSAKSTKQTELGVQNLKRIQFPLPDIKLQLAIAEQIEEKSRAAIECKVLSEKHKNIALERFESAIFNID